MAIGTNQNGYVREALRLVREMREHLGDSIEDEVSLKIEIENLTRIEELLAKAVIYGRDMFQEGR